MLNNNRNLKWLTFGHFVSSNLIRSTGITEIHLFLKTSVSARATWVRIPLPPLSSTDFLQKGSKGNFFIAYHSRFISQVFGKFSVAKVKKVVNLQSTVYQKFKQKINI